MARYQAVLFDLDGTLIDSVAEFIKESRKFASEHKIKISKKKMREIFLMLWESNKKKRFLDKVRMSYMVGREMGLSRKDTLSFMRGSFSKYKEFRTHPKMVPGAIKTIKNLLEKKVKIGVISSTHRKDVKSSLGYFRELFDVIICKEDIKNLKPAPDGILKACKKLKLNPSEVIYIGDLDDDILAARNAGATSVFFTRSSKLLDIPTKVKPDHKVDNLEKIVVLV